MTFKPRVWIFFSRPQYPNSPRKPIALSQPDPDVLSFGVRRKRDRAVEYVSLEEAQEMAKEAVRQDRASRENPSVQWPDLREAGPGSPDFGIGLPDPKKF